MKASLVTPRSSRLKPALWLLLLLYLLGVGAYYSLRYGGSWTEIDSARLSNSALAVVEQATIIPSGNAYPFGYAYPTLLAWLSGVTGVSIIALQTVILPLSGILVSGLVALLFYRS